MTTRHAVIDSPLGETTLVADGDALVGCYFRSHWYRPDPATFGTRVCPGDDAVLGPAAREYIEFVDGRRRSFDVPLRTDGDRLQESVWAALRRIPFGETTSYGRLAAELGDRTASQKVGQAIGRNPLCVFIPCHRVIGANGSLTGYAGGLRRKRTLLELEGRATVAEKDNEGAA